MLPMKGRILCVDDNIDTSLMVSILLRQQGYEVTLAGSFAEGLNLAKSEGFDLYLLDNKLPDGNGLELCRILREFAPQTPVVFHTAAAYEADRKHGLAAGADVYLTKPQGIDSLPDVIAQLINHGPKAFALESLQQYSYLNC